MDTEAASDGGTPELIGRIIGISLVTVVASLVGSLALMVSWNLGAARLFSLPTVTWAESLACLVSIWVLTSPLRFLRVKSVE
jgi:hypothetical protein